MFQHYLISMYRPFGLHVFNLIDGLTFSDSLMWVDMKIEEYFSGNQNAICSTRIENTGVNVFN